MTGTGSLGCTSKFSIIFCNHLMNLPLCSQSINYFSQSMRNLSNNILSLTGFLWVNWNGMFSLLVLWFAQTFKLFNYSAVINTTMMALILDLVFVTQRQIFLFLQKRHFCVWFSNVFLKTLFQITVVYLSKSQKSLQVSQMFAILMKLMRTRWMFLLNSQKLI